MVSKSIALLGLLSVGAYLYYDEIVHKRSYLSEAQQEGGTTEGTTEGETQQEGAVTTPVAIPAQPRVLPPASSGAIQTLAGISSITSQLVPMLVSNKLADFAASAAQYLAPMPEDKTIKALHKQRIANDKVIQAANAEKAKLETERTRLGNTASQIDIDTNNRKIAQNQKRIDIMTAHNKTINTRQIDLQAGKAVKQKVHADLQKSKGTIFYIFDIILEPALTNNLPITSEYYHDCKPGEYDISKGSTFRSFQAFVEMVPLLGSIFNIMAPIMCFTDGANENEESQDGLLYNKINAVDYKCVGPLCHKNYDNSQFMSQVKTKTTELITVPTKSVLGNVPDKQPPNTVKSGELYYADPGPGWFVKAGVAYENCPAGFTDTWSRCEYAIPSTKIDAKPPYYTPCDQTDGAGAHAVGLECWKPTSQVCADDCSKGWDGCKRQSWNGAKCMRWGRLTGASLVDDDCKEWGGWECIGGCPTSCSPVESLVRSSINRPTYCPDPNDENIAGLCQPKCPASTTRQGGLCAAGFQRASKPTAVIPAQCQDDRFDFQGLCYKKSDFDDTQENKWGIRSAGIAYMGHQELDRRDREDTRPSGGKSWNALQNDLATIRRARWDRGAGRPMTITARMKDKRTGIFDPLLIPTCKSLKDAGQAIDYDKPVLCRDETPPGFMIDETGLSYITKCDNLGYLWVDHVWNPNYTNRPSGGDILIIKSQYTGSEAVHNEKHWVDIWPSPGIKEWIAWKAPREPKYDDGTYPSDMYCVLEKEKKDAVDIPDSPNPLSKQGQYGKKVTKVTGPGYLTVESLAPYNTHQGSQSIRYGYYGGLATADGFYIPDVV